MSLTVKLKYLKHSPRKLRVFFGELKGKSLPIAIGQTKYVRSDAVGFIHQALKTAESLAKSHEFDPETMVVTSLAATDGPRIKRVRANSRGRANHFHKPMAHLVIEVEQSSKLAKPEAKKETK